MDPFRDPLPADGCWITLLAAAGLFLLARHDARFGDTRIASRVAIGFFVLGQGLASRPLLHLDPAAEDLLTAGDQKTV